MNAENIEIWVEEVKLGDKASFQNIVTHYQKPLYRYIRYLINSTVDIEDILQEVLFKIFKNINKYKSSTSFERWIYTITYNHTMNILKQRKRSKILLFENVPEKADQPNQDNSVSLDTMKALEKLSINERNLIFMRIYKDLSYKEISEIVNQSEGSLRKKYERARKKFIQYYNGEDYNYEGNKSKTCNNPTY